MRKYFTSFLFILMSLYAQSSIPERRGIELHSNQGTSISSGSGAAFLLPNANLPSPSLRCLAVQANGDVQLSWVLPDTAGSSSHIFNCYVISYSTNPFGPFTRIDSVNSFYTTTYLHAGAGANSASCYYFVQTKNLGGNVLSPAIDTLHSLFLLLNNPGNGTAVLNWSPLSTPLPPTSTGWYKIWRQFGAIPWTLIDSTRSLNFIDTISICHAFINYRIELADSSGCTSISNVAGANLKDVIAPTVVVMDSASVNGAGHAQLAWFIDPSKDTKGYVIYELVGGIWTAIDTIHGAAINSYTYLGSTAGSGQETYGVSAFDSCGNLSTLSPIQHTLFVTDKKDVCSQSLTLTWNNFIHLPGNIGTYTVMMSLNGGAYTSEAVLSPTDTTYTLTGLTPLSNYCFYIVVSNTPDAVSARSNIICYTATTPNEAKYNYLRVASVQGTSSVKVSAYVDNTAMVKQYNFYRALSSTASPVLIATVPASGATNISIVDNGVNTSLQSYYYTMYVVDSCGKEQSQSNVDETIFLTVTSDDGLSTNTLSWNDYSSWLGAVQSYDVYRAIDGVWQPTPVANIPYAGSGQNIYADNVAPYYTSSGKFEYFVQALEGPGNPYGFTDSSNSNVTKALQNATLYVPNAFVPTGVNNEFRPVGSFVDINDYHFFIYDRWGQKIFETSDKTAGWDGKINGHLSELGAYVYLISYKTSHGEFVDLKGTVTLVR
jgi:gliding motility-associated-like protein